jgi:phosphoribosylpyrophosphate synthetase
VFAPDRGATWRAHKIAKELHAPVIVANKMRRKDHSCDIQIMSCGDEFDINECLKTRDFCILVDDIVASGETLRAAVSCIKNIGTKHIIAVITHTVIAPVWPLLNDIDAWITTNTFPSSAQFTIVDIAPFIVSAITNRT